MKARSEDLTDLSVKCATGLDQRLRRLVQLENCRSYREIVVYFLEVMLTVLNHNPSFPLVLQVEEASPMTGQIRADIPHQLFDALSAEAHNFGMEATGFVRVSLQMALGCYEKLVPAGEILRKEEFARRIEAELKYRQKPGRFLPWLKRLKATLVRR